MSETSYRQITREAPLRARAVVVSRDRDRAWLREAPRNLHKCGRLTCSRALALTAPKMHVTADEFGEALATDGSAFAPAVAEVLAIR